MNEEELKLANKLKQALDKCENTLSVFKAHKESSYGTNMVISSGTSSGIHIEDFIDDKSKDMILVLMEKALEDTKKDLLKQFEEL